MENGQVKNLPYVEQVFSLLVVYRFIAKRAHERSWIRQNAEASRFMPDFVSHSGLFHIIAKETTKQNSFFTKSSNRGPTKLQAMVNET